MQEILKNFNTLKQRRPSKMKYACLRIEIFAIFAIVKPKTEIARPCILPGIISISCFWFHN